MWKINYNCLEKKAMDVMSPDFDKRKSLVFKFRLLDDDGVVYYKGVSDDRDSEDAFTPLYDYGLPNAGCTEIQYLRNRKWEVL